MTNKMIKENTVSNRVQEKWQEVEQDISNHSALLEQLSQIAEKFQSIDNVFSDFKQSQSDICEINEMLDRYNEYIKDSIQFLQDKISENSNSIESIKQKLVDLRETSTQNHKDLRSSVSGVKNHTKRLGNRTSIAVLLACLSLGLSIANFFRF